MAHCELNPIEMAWSQVKSYVKRNNKKFVAIILQIAIPIHTFPFRFTLTEVRALVYKGFQQVTADKWQSLVKHVQEKVSMYVAIWFHK